MPPLHASLWPVVLAAGDGRRLSALTADSGGVPVPKQFCSFGRPRPMLRWALDRAGALAPAERVVTIVAAAHRGWWEPALAGHPLENVVVQPANRGTAAGILLPLVTVLRRDPDAIVAILPSDHHVDDEAALRSTLEKAVATVAARRERIVLLGVTPDAPDTEYGWILPRSRPRRALVQPVLRFVEKPDVAVARGLLEQGALWNSFVLVASGRHLLHTFGETVPELLEPFLRDLVVLPRSGGTERLYAEIPTLDFSRHVLARSVDRLDVMAVPPCGWSDLGTPERLGAFLAAPSVPLSA